jgi:hypothetical protein
MFPPPMVPQLPTQNQQPKGTSVQPSYCFLRFEANTGKNDGSDVRPITILVYNSNWMHKSQSLFYLTTALYVLGVTITHLQEHKTTVTTASGNRYTALLSAASVEEFHLFHDSSRQQYGVTVTRCCSYSCFVLLKMGDKDARNM